MSFTHDTNKPNKVYKITRSDGQEYIGITVDLNKRVKEHTRSSRFASGISKVEVLFESIKYEDCQNLESAFIEKFDTFNNGLNLSPTGKGKGHRKGECNSFTTKGMTFSESAKEKMSKAHKSRTNYAKGWCHSAATRKRWSELRKGRVFNPKLSAQEVEKIKKIDIESFLLPKSYIILKIKKSQKLNIVKDEYSVSELRSMKLVSGNGKPVNFIGWVADMIKGDYSIDAPMIRNILAGKAWKES